MPSATSGAFGELDVVQAEAEEMAPDVDRRTTAELRYRNGGATASMLSEFTGTDQKAELGDPDAVDPEAFRLRVPGRGGSDRH